MIEKKQKTDEEIGREIAHEMFNSRIPINQRYVIVAKRAREVMKTKEEHPGHLVSYEEKYEVAKIKMQEAETAIENLRCYLQDRLRALEHGACLIEAMVCFRQIADQAGFEIIPAQPIRVVRK